MYRNRLFLVLACMALMLTSCSGEDGSDGIDGMDGATGPQGAPGVDGNANVIASPWIPAQFSTTLAISSYFSYDDERLNSEISDTAVFLVYGRKFTFSTSDIIIELPVTFNQKSYYYKVFAHQGSIFFRAQSVDQTTPYNFNDFSEFRFVIIPANEISSKSTGRDFHKMTYEEVVDYLNLEY